MISRRSLTGLFLVLAGGAAGFSADVSVQLSEVHLCCGSCVKGANAVVATVPGAQATVSQDDDTIDVTAGDVATVQKVVDALVAAGFFGRSDNAAIKVDAGPGAADENVKSLRVERVHLCCPKCITAVNEALAKVPGVTGNTATKGASSFEVTGDFNAKAVIDALRAEGWSGRAAP
jgi:copper chaperone CopZ